MTKNFYLQRIYIVPAILIYILLSSSIVVAAQKKYQFNNNQLKVTLVPRTPEQIAAFYEGRGFSKVMINTLKQQCFITVGIRNKSKNIIWHDLSNWRFSDNQGKIKRNNRTYWKETWKKMNISLAHQSTFRWTLLPEKLDFRNNESEGGNITLPYTNKAITLDASFKTHADKSGKSIAIKLTNIRCAKR